MKKFFNYCRSQISAFVSPEPEVQSDYVDKVVYLLRRDFDSKQQNEIIVAVAAKLSDLRDKDMIKMESDYRVLKHNTLYLRERLILS